MTGVLGVTGGVAVTGVAVDLAAQAAHYVLARPVRSHQRFAKVVADELAQPSYRVVVQVPGHVTLRYASDRRGRAAVLDVLFGDLQRVELISSERLFRRAGEAAVIARSELDRLAVLFGGPVVEVVGARQHEAHADQGAGASGDITVLPGSLDLADPSRRIRGGVLHACPVITGQYDADPIF